jgi:hypothetical protein
MSVASGTLLQLIESVTSAYEEAKTVPVSESLPRELARGVILREHRAEDGAFVAEIIAKGISGAELEFANFKQTQISANLYTYVDTSGNPLSWDSAQSLPRKIRFLGLDALKAKNLRLRSWVIRNERVRNGNETVSPGFVLQSQTSISRFVPRVEVSQQIDLGQADHQKHELGVYVVELFQTLGDAPTFPLSITLDVVGMSQVGASNPSISIPLVRMNPIEFRDSSEWSSPTSVTVSQISTAVSHALLQLGPTYPISQLQFRMQVFQGDANPLTLSNVVLDTGRIRN